MPIALCRSRDLRTLAPTSAPTFNLSCASSCPRHSRCNVTTPVQTKQKLTRRREANQTTSRSKTDACVKEARQTCKRRRHEKQKRTREANKNFQAETLQRSKLETNLQAKTPQRSKLRANLQAKTPRTSKSRRGANQNELASERQETKQTTTKRFSNRFLNVLQTWIKKTKRCWRKLKAFGRKIASLSLEAGSPTQVTTY